jgi:hypothetical protein
MADGVYTIDVGLALRRPPVEDVSVHVLVAAATVSEACCLAAQIAQCDPDVVMAVRTTMVNYYE